MKQVYRFAEQGLTVFRDGEDVVLEVKGIKYRFSTYVPDHRHRSPADRLRRAIELLETDIFYDPEGVRPEMVNADTVR